MKKRLFRLALIALIVTLVLGPMSLASYAEEVVSFVNKNVKNADGVKVMVHGGFPLEFDTPIKISDGRTLVPLRKIAEAFHYEVSYDEATKTISLNRDTSFIKMVVGDNSVLVSNSYDLRDGYFIMEKQPDIYEGRTYVPLRAIGELFRRNVIWNAQTKTIYINDVAASGGNEELASGERQTPYYYYYGQVFEEKPSGSGYLEFGFERASYFRGEFKKGLPDGNGVMGYTTGGIVYNIMGNFKAGMLMEGSIQNGPGFSFVKGGMVTASYVVKNGNYVKVPNDVSLDPNWFKTLQAEVSLF